MGSDAKIVITADDADVSAAMRRVSNVVQESMGQIQGHFASFQAGFEKLNTVMVAATAVLAGGKVFKESVEAVKAMTLEAGQLSRTLGISAEDANVLNTALGNVFLDKDTYVDATRQITKNLNSNSKAFDDLGVATRDSQGNLLPMQQIVSNTAAALMQFQEGADRNVMAQQLLGKSWEDTLKLAKLTPDVMADAAKEVQDYHKELDPAAVQRYRAAMENVGDVFEGVKVAIGKSVMPALSAMGEWLSNIGPGLVEIMIEVMKSLEAAFDAVMVVVRAVWDVGSTIFTALGDAISACFGGERISAMQFFANCLKVVQVAFVGLRVGVELAIEIIKGCLAALVADAVRMANTVGAALTLDFAGAKAAWRQGTADLEAVVDGSAQRMVEIAEKGRADIEKAMSPTEYKAPSVSAPEQKGGNRKSFDIGDKKEKKETSRSSEWEAQLSEMKAAFQEKQAAEESFRQFSKAQELTFWQEKLAISRKGSDEEKSVRKKVADLKLEIGKQEFEAQLAKYKTEIEAADKNMQQKLAVAEKMAADIRSKYGAESKEYADSQRQIVQIKQQAAEQIRQINEVHAQQARSLRLAEIDQAEATAQLALAQGRKTQNEILAAEREFEAQRYQINRQAAQEKLALYEKDPVKYAQVQAELAQIDAQYSIKRIQLQAKQAQQDMKYWNGFESSMSSTYASGLNKMLSGTLKFKDALKGVFREIGKAFVQELIVKQVAEWAAMQTKQMAMFIAGKAKELAIALGFMAEEKAAEGTATATQVATQKALGITGVMSNASIAATAAMASVAAIPVYGWAMAPEVGAATYAAGLGYLASASQGYDIPANVNPLTQLHEQEMVLPKPYANVIRDMAAGGGGTSSNASGNSYNVTYNDNSGRLSREQIRQNIKVIKDELERTTRRGA